MSSIQNILGEPINRFSQSRYPTLQDVLCFYSQFWGKKGSVSSKEKLVEQELRKWYERENIHIINEKTVRNKISRNVAELKKIIKFQTKKKTAENIEHEARFRSKLQEVFDIRSSTIQTDDEAESENTVNSEPNESPLNTSMEVDNFNGIKIYKFEIVLEC